MLIPGIPRRKLPEILHKVKLCEISAVMFHFQVPEKITVPTLSLKNIQNINQQRNKAASLLNSFTTTNALWLGGKYS